MKRPSGSIAESRVIAWTAPESQSTIECRVDVMDQIRAYACDSLLLLSHAGRDVGGVMFGTPQPDGLRIVTWRPITSEYADGSQLRLSHRDRMNLAVQLEAARVSPDTKDLRPVGWFVSHPHSGVAMTPSDLDMYSAFFPEWWQVTLVIHPTEDGRAEAGFFVRESDGSVRSEASYKNFVLEPGSPLFSSDPPAVPAEVTPPVAISDQPLQEREERESTPAPAPPPIEVNRPSAPPPVIPAPAFETPAFQTDEPLPTRERWLWAIPIALALGIAGWLLYNRQKPAEGASLAFHVAGSAGRVAQLEWNPNTRTIRNADHGEIDITDAGKTSQVMLTNDELHAGKTTYLAQSGNVSFELIVSPANGPALHDTTSLIDASAVTPVAPASGPQNPAANPALAQQVQKLTQDLRRERARADQLQGLVRILEQRLQIDPNGSRGSRPR